MNLLLDKVKNHKEDKYIDLVDLNNKISEATNKIQDFIRNLFFDANLSSVSSGR